jgi:hypothetical protein
MYVHNRPKTQFPGINLIGSLPGHSDAGCPGRVSDRRGERGDGDWMGGAMGSVEWSDKSRRLTGVDQALGDGDARRPAELFDQLRERLSRLEPNHPSAYQPESAGAQVKVDSGNPADPPAQPLEEAGELEAGDRLADEEVDLNQEARASEPERAAAGQERGEGWLTPGADAPGLGEVSSDLLDAGRADRGDPYQPWFMSGELGAPWFAE